jgi:hypothetical protein
VHPLRPFRPISSVALAAILAALVVACTGQPGGSGGPGPSDLPSTASGSSGGRPFTPLLISSENVVGPNRFVFGLLDAAGSKPVSDPLTKVQVAFQDSGSTPTTIQPTTARFIWAIPDERGVYAADVSFPSAGDWTAVVNASGGSIPSGTVAVQFQVKTKGAAIPIGGKAPSTTTPTATTAADIARISSDAAPDPTFYTTSVDEALAQHKPFVLVFATPAFCTSKQCGPTLEGIKAVAKDEPGMTFINVEPYKMEYTGGRLQPVLDASGQLQVTDTTRAWGILSEPWTYVVDRDGIVRGSFEMVASADELKAAIASVR